MTKTYTHQELCELQRKANLGVELLNETVVRIVKEITEAMRKAYDEGKPLAGLSFELVFVDAPAPATVDEIDEVDDEGETEEDDESESEAEDEGQGEAADEGEIEEADEVEEEKPVNKAAKKPAKKSKKSK